jgi:predicted RNase H-like nuclease (RuvC/YqgF family)
MTSKIIIFLSVYIISAALYSETILLRNGQIIQGKVLGHDSESVTINTEGATKVIPKSTVHKVIFSSNSADLQKFLHEKKKQSRLQKRPDPGKADDDDELSSIDEMVGEKQDINKKVNLLEQKIDKYEKKISNLRSKIHILKQKIKHKSNNE